MGLIGFLDLLSYRALRWWSGKKGGEECNGSASTCHSLLQRGGRCPGFATQTLQCLLLMGRSLSTLTVLLSSDMCKHRQPRKTDWVDSLPNLEWTGVKQSASQSSLYPCLHVTQDHPWLLDKIDATECCSQNGDKFQTGTLTFRPLSRRMRILCPAKTLLPFSLKEREREREREWERN